MHMTVCLPAYHLQAQKRSWDICKWSFRWFPAALWGHDPEAQSSVRAASTLRLIPLPGPIFSIIKGKKPKQFYSIPKYLNFTKYEWNVFKNFYISTLDVNYPTGWCWINSLVGILPEVSNRAPNAPNTSMRHVFLLMLQQISTGKYRNVKGLERERSSAVSSEAFPTFTQAFKYDGLTN